MTESDSPENSCKYGSNLAHVFHEGYFAVAIELSPPLGPNRGYIERQIEQIRGYGDAYNVTSNQSARVHIASLPVCIMLKQAGLDPVYQITCRDYNRLSMQANLLGASLHNIKTVFAISGDHMITGDHPHVKSVYDIDSINLIRMIRMMRDEQVFENGKTIPRIAPDFFIGAAINPFAPPYDFRVMRLAKKVAAGVQFVQSQLVFNVPRFKEYMARVVDLGLHEKVAIMAGIGPARSQRAIEYMAYEIPGLDVPEWVLKRMQGLSKEDQAKAGFDISLEIIQQVREIEGVRGIHLMPINWTQIVPELVTQLGLYPRPICS
ncbi:MAG: methylenetetrahydrofolate reductase [Anaerolineae bacterium]|nr:methylenetetrahydrofolate reductase [Anaerolineae bacterium]